LKRQTEWIAKMTGTKRALLQDRVPAAQLIKTWNVPGWSSRDLTLLQLVGKVLTEGKNSRLFKRLVFTDQLAADVQATVGPFEIGSQFQIIALANPGVDIATLERAVDEELAAFLLQGPTPEELERLKSRTYAAQIRALERIDGGSGKAHMLAESQVYGGSPDYYKKSLTWMREATPADLQRVAQQWLSDGVFVLEVHPTPEYATAAAGADRSRLPEPSTPPDLKLPPLTRTTLSNGLEVVLAERHNAPLVQLTLILDAGASADDPAHPGIAGLTLAMLDEGTKTRNALQIADRAEVLGVQFLAASSLDSAYLGMGAITSQLPASVELFSDILINATFPQEDFERARAQALAGIQFSKVQPRGIVSRLVPQLLYGKGHPYANPVAGTEASLKAMTVADLRAFKDRWYRPDNAKLLIVGDTTIEQIKPLLEKYLAAWKTPAAARGKKELAAVALPGKQRIFLVNRTGAEQSTIVAAHVVPPRSDRDFLAFKTFNEILGGMFTSRVNMNLREGKGWAYGASSSLRETQGPGMLSASASVQQDKTAESMVEIARELRDIVGGRKPTAQEIELARDSLVLALPGSNETATEVSNSYSSVLTFGLPDDYWNTYVSGVNALTREQLAAAGARLLQPDSITWLVIGDLAKIEQGVRKLGLGEVQVLDADGNVVR
ncbi:MAG TPA: insulinase family protein, partial [Steroidobacteraceae bacterium]|nr:insulinase family protein [Steroidobacteraceae bacterium]